MKRHIGPVLAFLAMIAAGTSWSPDVDAADGISAQIAEAHLVSEVETVRPGKPFWVALRLRMTDGWHTYWRNPGDSGLATAIAWTLPDGYSAGPIRWPTPEVFRIGPIANYGYAGEVWLLTEITPSHGPHSGGSAVLRAEAQWLACAEICVPEQADLELALPVADGNAPAFDAARIDDFARARATLPEQGTGRGVFSADEAKVQFAFGLPELATQPLAEVWLFPAEYGVIVHGAPQQFDVNGRDLVLTAIRDTSDPDLPDTITGVLVVRQAGGKRAFAVRALPAETGSIQ